MSSPTNPSNPGIMQPFVVDRGGLVIPDEYFHVADSPDAETATFIHVGLGSPDNTGDVVVQYANGTIDFWQGKKSDTIIPGKIARVLSSAVVYSHVFTGTALYATTQITNIPSTAGLTVGMQLKGEVVGVPMTITGITDLHTVVVSSTFEITNMFSTFYAGTTRTTTATRMTWKGGV